MRITHRWGGLQSFTFDGLPVIGLFDPQRRIHGMAGFSGLGNSFSNVGAGACGEAERCYATTIELLMAPERESALAGRRAHPRSFRYDPGENRPCYRERTSSSMTTFACIYSCKGHIVPEKQGLVDPQRIEQ